MKLADHTLPPAMTAIGTTTTAAMTRRMRAAPTCPADTRRTCAKPFFTRGTVRVVMSVNSA
jgi:hypothetical protein